MPCASVLVLELLRQAQHPEKQLIMNRSGIIQDVSVLISCCESLTESGQNNYQICKQAQSIFSKSLDSILNHVGSVPKAPSLDNLTASPHYEQTATMENGLPGAAVQDPTLDWTAWLDSVGLQADPWLDSIMQAGDFPMDQTV